MNSEPVNAYPKGILFDLDDTIIAYGVLAGRIWRRLCEEYASTYELCEADHLFNAMDEVRKWYWSDSARHKIGRMDLDNTRTKIIRLAFEKLGIDNVLLAKEISETFADRLEERLAFFPKAEDTLKYLTDHNVSLALMTNGEAQKQRHKVNKFRLERFFKTILIEGELGYGKPEKAVYIRALDDLGLEPDAVWSIGDNLLWDVQGPQKLGIFGIWNNVRGERLPVSSEVVPDRIVSSISELIEET